MSIFDTSSYTTKLQREGYLESAMEFLNPTKAFIAYDLQCGSRWPQPQPYYDKDGVSPFGYHIDDPQFALPSMHAYPDPEKCAQVPSKNEVRYGSNRYQQSQKGNVISWWEQLLDHQLRAVHRPHQNHSPPALQSVPETFAPGSIPPPLPQVPVHLSRTMYVAHTVLVKPKDKRMPRRYANNARDDYPRLEYEFACMPNARSNGLHLTDRQIMLLFRGTRADAHDMASSVITDRGEFYANFGYLCCMSDAFLHTVGLTRDRIPPTANDRPSRRAEVDAHNRSLWMQKFGARGVDIP